MENNTNKCIVCGKEATEALCSVGGGSVAYCADCAKQGRESLTDLICMVSGCSNREGLADWAKEVLDFNIPLLGLTDKEFWEKCRENDDAYWAAVARGEAL